MSCVVLGKNKLLLLLPRFTVSYMKLVILLIHNNLFIDKVLCTLIYRRCSLYSFLFEILILMNFNVVSVLTLNVTREHIIFCFAETLFYTVCGPYVIWNLYGIWWITMRCDICLFTFFSHKSLFFIILIYLIGHACMLFLKFVRDLH